MTATQQAQAKIHIEMLCGLYEDLADNLHDADLCDELLVQVEDLKAQLADMLFVTGLAR